MKSSIHRQRGLGFIGWLFAIAAIGVMIVLGVRILPPYAQHNTVLSIVESLREEPDISRKTTAEIRSLIKKRFDINMVTSVSTRDITISRKGRNTVIDISYQVKEPLFANIEALITFSDQVEIER